MYCAAHEGKRFIVLGVRRIDACCAWKIFSTCGLTRETFLFSMLPLGAAQPEATWNSNHPENGLTCRTGRNILVHSVESTDC
jgi:hypothetical protein